ncbi:hypothetical protein LOD99_8349 [Oopsacas minuta]|uniref:Uncharacterized protein n=1 Tax=Oopsacas minuta TaxID=111878 RepID=A0AAV7JGZ8_9METZ|nr:hypothetical protein LOD99_8349 [Oopsacas minuta]
MVDPETESHRSISSQPERPFDRLPIIPSISTDFSPEDEITTDYMLHNLIRKVEKEWLFNIIFIILFILTFICLFISILIAIWGDEWFSKVNFTINCGYTS